MIIFVFILLHFFSIPTNAWLTTEEISRLGGKQVSQDKVFGMFRMGLKKTTAPKSPITNLDQFTTRILNPGDVNKLYEFLISEEKDLSKFEFLQSGAPYDLLDFFRLGESPTVNSPTSSGTWDPSVHGRVVDSRRSNERLDRNMGIYRSLFGTKNFPVIALTYNLDGVAKVNHDSEDAQNVKKMSAAAYYADHDLIMPVGETETCYYDTSSNQEYLDFLNEIYNSRKTIRDYKNLDPATRQSDYSQVGVGDAKQWREVVLRGKKVDAKENTWLIENTRLAYISIWSYDPTAPRSYYAAVDGVTKFSLADDLKKRVDSAPVTNNNARLQVRYFTVNADNRNTIATWCLRFLDLFPNVDGAFQDQAGYETAQKAARKVLREKDAARNDASLGLAAYRAAHKDLIVESRFQSAIYKAHFSSCLAVGTEKATCQKDIHFSLENYGKKQDYYTSEFEKLWRNIWLGVDIAGKVLDSLDQISLLKQLDNYLTFITEYKAKEEIQPIFTELYAKFKKYDRFWTDDIREKFPIIPKKDVVEINKSFLDTNNSTLNRKKTYQSMLSP